MENVTASADPLQTAIIAGILIADEFFKERIKAEGVDKLPDLNEIEEITLKMISSIDEVV